MKIKKMLSFIKNNRYILLVILFSILITTHAQYPSLIKDYIFADDVKKDSEMYCLGPKCIISEPYNLTFKIIWSFIDPVTLSKITPYFISLIFSIFLFYICKELINKKSGFLVVILSLLHFWTTSVFFGGLRRSFGTMISAMFLYFLIKKKHVWIIISIFFSLFTYPPISLVLGLSYLISLIWDNKLYSINKYSKIKKYRVQIISALLFILVFTSSFFMIFTKNENILDYFRKPESSASGRFPMNFEGYSYYYYLMSDRIGMASSPVLNFLILSFIVVGIINLKKLKWNPELMILWVSSTFLYIVSFFMFPNLYYPAKMVQNFIPLFIIIGLFINLKNLKKGIKKNKKWIISILTFFILICSLLIFNFSFKPSFLYICPYKGLYESIDELKIKEKNVHFVGFPKEMYCIYLFTDLTDEGIFLNYEKIPRTNKSDKTIFNEKMSSYIDAYYSEDIKEVNSFCTKYDISHLIVDPYLFSEKFNQYGYGQNWKEMKDGYLIPLMYKKEYTLLRLHPKKEKTVLIFEPFDSQLRELLSNNSDFALLKLPEEKRIEIEGEEMFIVECPINYKEFNLL